MRVSGARISASEWRGIGACSYICYILENKTWIVNCKRNITNNYRSDWGICFVTWFHFIYKIYTHFDSHFRPSDVNDAKVCLV